MNNIENGIYSYNEDITNLITATNGKAPGIYETASGSIASFSDGADDMPMKSCVVNIEPIQEGEGDPSPENVRPISGRTGLTAYRTGEIVSGYSIINGYYDANGTIQSSDSMRMTQDYIPVIGGTKCLIKVKLSPASTSKLRVHQYDTSQGWINQAFVTTESISSENIDTFIIDLDENARYIRFSLPKYSVFELYKNAELISGNWETEAGTVCGGSVDIVSGKLVVDKRGKTFTGTEQEEWFKNSSGNYFYTKLEDFNMGVTNSQLCDIFPNAVISSSNDQQGVYAFNSNSHQIFGLYVRWSSLMSMDVTAFKSWLSSNPLTVMYELASPVEYQLTTQEVRTLLGVNNIWSDGGDVEVEYPADTKMYIDQKITEAIAAAMA